MIEIKPGVSIRGISPEIALAISIINSVMEGETLVITCVVDGRHRSGSLHYIGNAVDIRRTGLKNAAITVDRIRAALGAEFDVILETSHIHVEFQPKNPLNLK